MESDNLLKGFLTILLSVALVAAVFVVVLCMGDEPDVLNDPLDDDECDGAVLECGMVVRMEDQL